MGTAQTKASSQYFYRDLAPLPSFEAATDLSQHVDLPDDWWILITDIIGSTKAIEAGAYKSVNSAGVCCIAAVVNVDKSTDIPFIFGGDGATIAVPDCMLTGVKRALLGAQQLARDAFQLELRIGAVRVADLRQGENWVRLCKYQLSPHVTQPALSGRGWDQAEKLIKSKEHFHKYEITAGPGLEAEANFEGFECRWQSVDAVNGHKLAVLVLGTDAAPDKNMRAYQAVLNEINKIYGDVRNFHPLRADRLQLSTSVRNAAAEAKIRASRSSFLGKWIYIVKTLCTILIGKFIFRYKVDTQVIRGSRYRDEVVENSDFRKFDGTLRMVIDGSAAQEDKLRAYLAQQHAAGRLVYGLHRSQQALVTCIIQSYNGNHTHFVDGSDGGYAVAARALKAQLAQLQLARP